MRALCLLPPKVELLFMKNDFLKEAHAAELLRLCNFHTLEPWLEMGGALCDIVPEVVDRHRGTSAGKAPTASVFRKYVDAYNTMVAEAEGFLTRFPKPFVDALGKVYDPRRNFLDSLVSERLQYATFPTVVSESFTNPVLDDAHARELL